MNNGNVTLVHNEDEFTLIVNGQTIDDVKSFAITGGVDQITVVTVSINVPIIASGYDKKKDGGPTLQ